MIEPLVNLWVPGVPQPQGSKRLFKGNLVEGNDRTLRPWRGLIAGEARAAYQGRGFEPTRDAVAVILGFMFPRPKSHFGTGRNAHELKSSAPAYKSTKPDVDKLARAVLDALTGIVYVDDAQVADLVVWKDYGPPGVSIRVEFPDVFARSRVVEADAAA
jgi:crossover junction endodeoxyribonuclease RusA